jgi:hypothetical protein
MIWPQVHDFAKLHRSWRNGHAHDRLARLGRGYQVADRTNAADAGGDRGHLIERSALDEFLEAAKLGDMEERFGDLAVVVEMNGDLGVTLDPRHRVYDNGFHDLLLSRNPAWSSDRGRGHPAAR